jgi:Holliday junction resolvasome RuvABC endonuclease subunit
MIYIGLDTATTMGVAVFAPNTHKVYVAESKGSPLQQMRFISEKVLPGLSLGHTYIALEQLHNMRNAVTVRSFMERYGYIKWTLAERDWKVFDIPPQVARASLGCTTKMDVFDYFLPAYKGSKLTHNHTDALALALYIAKEGWAEFHPERLRIYDLGGEE